MSFASQPHVNAASPTTPLALMGGTFDPVHWGHLRVASETATALRLPELRLIPSKTPVHRTRPGATEAQRFAMLELGIAAARDPALRADNREITRATPSYTALTLDSLRAEFPTRPLIWVIGVDAFLHIHTWFQWPRLFELAHFVVLNRPGFAVAQVLSNAMADVWQGRLTRGIDALHAATHGHIYLHTVTPQAISATAIRNTIAAAEADEALLALLPSPVLAYIRAHHLYTQSPIAT
jgi:nicotinate-nucleotide adenylyltransferase